MLACQHAGDSRDGAGGCGRRAARAGAPGRGWLAAATLVLAASAGSAAPEALVIPAAETATVARLLPAEGEALPPTRFRLTAVQIRVDEVAVTFAGPAATATVVLVHPSRGAAGEPRTRFFAVRDAAPAQPGLGAALAAFITACEARPGGDRSPWAAPGSSGPASGPAATAGGPERRGAGGPEVRGAGGLVALGALVVIAGGLLVMAWRRRLAAPAASRRGLQPGRWLLVALLGFAAGLLLCELGARLVYRRVAGDRALVCDAHRCRLVVLGELDPRIRAYSMRSYPDGVDYWLDPHADEDGRGGNAAAAPGPVPGRRRMVFVGDSVTFGSGVPRAGTFARWLAAALGDGVEVWNLAVPGHDLDQHRITVAERAAALRPDVIVLCLWIDDVGRKGVGPLGAYRRWRDHRLAPADPVLVRTAWGRAITRRSRLAQLLVLRSLARAAWVDVAEHDDQERQRALASLRAIAADADAAHARLVVLLAAPLDRRNFDDRGPRGHVTWLRGIAAEGVGPAVPILDARDLLGPVPLEEIRLDACCHLNSEGHRRLGEALAGRLRRLGVLDGERGAPDRP
ncbi:MAG TPA: GDSL-type esterase/lipase family protein [Polyangia bacterium]|jgi:lysophospholipase L1-like esterase